MLTSSGSDRHTIESHLGNHDVTFRLPAGVTCKHCVLQWTYVAGKDHSTSTIEPINYFSLLTYFNYFHFSANIWGTCPDGTTALGCGPQENYRSCSDITIV